MEILAWLVPPAGVTLLAMLWALWAGRPRNEGRRRDDASYERFADAIAREHPGAGRAPTRVVRDRSTGIAVRRSRGAGRPLEAQPTTRRRA